jgi:hypothetical protein
MNLSKQESHSPSVVQYARTTFQIIDRNRDTIQKYFTIL